MSLRRPRVRKPRSVGSPGTRPGSSKSGCWIGSDMALKPVYYFFGTDDYLMEDAFEKIKKEALTGGFASMNYHVYEGKTCDAGELVSTASTMPAFAEGGGELLRWIRDDAARQGKKIAPSAAVKLLETTGNRLRDIKGELDKIVLFVGAKPEIDDKDVEESGLDRREEAIFGLSDAIGKKDVKAAFRVYERISGEEPIKVLGAVSRQVRTLLKIKSFIRKGTPAAKLPGLVGLFPKHA